MAEPRQRLTSGMPINPQRIPCSEPPTPEGWSPWQPTHPEAPLPSMWRRYPVLRTPAKRKEAQQ